MKEQREKARAARKTTNYMGADVTVYQSIDPAVTTEFVGYDRLTHQSEITVLTTEDELAEALTDGQKRNDYRKGNSFLRYHGRPAGRYRRDPHRERRIPGRGYH